MIIIRCSDKFIVGNVQKITEFSDNAGHLVHILLRGHPCVLCLQLDLLTVLIGSRLEEYVVPFLSLKTCDAVCQNDLIIVADMRLPGGIRNGSCQIVRSFVLHFLLLSFKKKSPV